MKTGTSLSIFSEITIKGLQIPNRVVLPPIVRFGWAGNDGLVTENHVLHYEKIAKGGCGLIILEAHAVTRDGRLDNTQLGIWSDEHIFGLARVIRACHKYGAKVLVQIHHAGFKTPPSVTTQPVSSSDYAVNPEIMARELTPEEIGRIQDDFITAAIRVQHAGADGIEIHGAHGFLISQFMSPLINRRNDEYGGHWNTGPGFPLKSLPELKKNSHPIFL